MPTPWLGDGRKVEEGLCPSNGYIARMPAATRQNVEPAVISYRRIYNGIDEISMPIHPKFAY
jgi:hypothetical protein